MDQPVAAGSAATESAPVTNVKVGQPLLDPVIVEAMVARAGHPSDIWVPVITRVSTQQLRRPKAFTW